jgi:hypothetical protein
MDWLNHHHLHSFWVVARTGSIARASEELHLSQPTISGRGHPAVLDGSEAALAPRLGAGGAEPPAGAPPGPATRSARPAR